MGDRGRVQGGRCGGGYFREQGPGGYPGRLGKQDRAERSGQQHRQGQEEEAEGTREEAEGRDEEEDPRGRGEVGARGPDPRAEGEAGGEEGVRAWQLLKSGESRAAEFSGGAHHSCLERLAQRAALLSWEGTPGTKPLCDAGRVRCCSLPYYLSGVFRRR